MNMIKGAIFSSILGLSVVACHQRQIPYPEPYPDSVATKFLPGLVSVDSLDFNSTFSPDGQSFYFSRSNNGQWDIFVSNYQNNGWSTPIRLPFSDEKYSEADPMFSPDGKLYFISNRPVENELAKNDFDIWYVSKHGQSWSLPENRVEVNSDSSEYYISFSRKGDLYFGSSRPGGYGSNDIYVSRLVNGKYSMPENLGANINSPESEHDPAVSDNDRLMVFKSENRADGLGQADLYFSTFDGTKGWSPAQNLGVRINTDSYEYCPYFTPDGKYFFFSSQSDVMWIDAEALQRIIITKDVRNEY